MFLFGWFFVFWLPFSEQIGDFNIDTGSSKPLA